MSRVCSLKHSTGGNSSSDSNIGGRLSSKNLHNLKIPIYNELLTEVNGYEDAVILNQLLYYSDKVKRPFGRPAGLTVYDLRRLCCWDKSLQTLRKRLEILINKGFITKQNNSLYGMTYYKPVPELCVDNNALVTMLEGKDLSSGDYYTAAILNFFRQRFITDGAVGLEISARELKEFLQLDRNRGAIRARLSELEQAKVIKSSLKGRIYHYEVDTEYLLDKRTPELLNELGDRLNSLFTEHLKRFNCYSGKNNQITFSRMLMDGYSYDAIRHIIAYLGYKENRWRGIISNASHMRKHYAELYDTAYRSISRRKACRYHYKLENGYLPPINLPAKKDYGILSKQPDTDENRWFLAMMYVENNKGLILRSIRKFSNLSEILDEEDVYSMVRQTVFNLMKKGKDLQDISFSYMQKCIFRFIQHEAPCGVEMPEDDLLPEYVTEQPLTDYSKREIPAKLAHLPLEAVNIVLDYFDREGRKYSQRELSKKYSVSLGKINGIIQKYVPIVCELYSLPPPPKFYSGKAAK